VAFKLDKVVTPEVTSRVPVKEAAEVIVWPLINSEVIGPAVKVPMLPEVAKRSVEEAVVE